MIKINLKILFNFLFLGLILFGLAGCASSSKSITSIAITKVGDQALSTPIPNPTTIPQNINSTQPTISGTFAGNANSFSSLSFNFANTTPAATPAPIVFTVPRAQCNIGLGTWSVNLSTATDQNNNSFPGLIKNNSYQLNVTAIEEGTSPISNYVNFTVDIDFTMTIPSFGQVFLNSTQTMQGTANPFTTIDLFLDGSLIPSASGNADSLGNWSINLNSSPGSHSLLAKNNTLTLSSQFCVQTSVLDSSFASSGILTGVGSGTGYSVFTSDNDFYIGGQDNAANFVLQKYNSSGTPDGIFNANVIASTTLVNSLNIINALAVHPDGSIFVAGQDKNTGNFAFSKYDSTGIFQFHIMPTGASGNATSLIIDQDGNIIIGGYDNLGNGIIFKYDVNGNFLNSNSFGLTSTGGTSLAIDQNGKISFSMFYMGSYNIKQLNQNLSATVNSLSGSSSNSPQLQTLSTGNLLVVTDTTPTTFTIYDNSYVQLNQVIFNDLNGSLRSAIVYPQFTNFPETDTVFVLYDAGSFGIGQVAINNLNNISLFNGFYDGASGSPTDISVAGDPRGLSFDKNGNVYALGSTMVGGNIQVAKYLNCHAFAPVSYDSGPAASGPNSGTAEFPSNIYGYANGILKATTNTISTGQFAYNMPSLPVGVNNIRTVSEYNPGRINISRQDTITVQAAPTITNPSSSASVIIEGPQYLAGTAPAGSRVQINFGCCALGFAIADGAGTWKLAVGPLTGTNQVRARIIYSDGSVSNESAPVNVLTTTVVNQPTVTKPYNGVKSEITSPALPIKFDTSVASINTKSAAGIGANPKEVRYSIEWNAAAVAAGYDQALIPATLTSVDSNGNAVQALPPVVTGFPISIVVRDSNGIVIDTATQNVTVGIATPTPVQCANAPIFTKSVDNNNPCPGDPITYTINLTNNFNSPISPSVSDFISPNLTNIIPTSSAGPTSFQTNSNSVVWTINSLDPMKTAMLTIGANVLPSVPAGTIITNQAQVTNSDPALPIDCATNNVSLTVKNCPTPTPTPTPISHNRAIYSVRFNQPFCGPVSAVVFGSKSPIAPQLPPLIKQASTCGILIEADMSSNVQFFVTPTT